MKKSLTIKSSLWIEKMFVYFEKSSWIDIFSQIWLNVDKFGKFSRIQKTFKVLEACSDKKSWIIKMFVTLENGHNF